MKTGALDITILLTAARARENKREPVMKECMLLKNESGKEEGRMKKKRVNPAPNVGGSDQIMY